ncbi:hypothetical protein [Mesorhizobium escarrei]|nr:hypothetical protein [Mesorhizobium escarrei]
MPWIDISVQALRQRNGPSIHSPMRTSLPIVGRGGISSGDHRHDDTEHPIPLIKEYVRLQLAATPQAGLVSGMDAGQRNAVIAAIMGDVSSSVQEAPTPVLFSNLYNASLTFGFAEDADRDPQSYPRWEADVHCSVCAGENREPSTRRVQKFSLSS